MLKNITKIELSLKDEVDRIGRVAQLLTSPSPLQPARETPPLTLFQTLRTKIQQFFFKHLPLLVPKTRRTPEAQVKTVLALLLSQPLLRDFFLNHPKRRQAFYAALEKTAKAWGVSLPSPTNDNPWEISRLFTTLRGQKKSLLDQPQELELQTAALTSGEKNTLLYQLLSEVERPPLTSTLELSSQEERWLIPLTTHYAQYKILEHDVETGMITFSCIDDHATSSIRTRANLSFHGQGTVNQRVVKDEEAHRWIGAYCGELTDSYHVLEQLLLLLDLHAPPLQVIESPPAPCEIRSLPILFTSLLSWHEMGPLCDQHFAIQKWNGALFKTPQGYVRLHLLHYNLSLRGFPPPAEIKATLQDYCDEALLHLCNCLWLRWGLSSPPLHERAARLESLNTLGEALFLERQKLTLEEIDRFRAHKPELLKTLSSLPPTEEVHALSLLLRGEKMKPLERLIYLNYVAQGAGYLHNKNSMKGLERTESACAVDKAAYGYAQICGKKFDPLLSKQEEQELFNTLYETYFLREEPLLHIPLSTGEPRKVPTFYKK